MGEKVMVDFNGILNGSWKWEMKQFAIDEREEVLTETNKENE